MRRATIILAMSMAVPAIGGCDAGGRGGGGGVRAARDFSLSAPWQAYEQVIVHSRNGRVELTLADVSAIEIDGKLRVRGATQTQADANLDQLQIVAEADANDPKTFRIELKVPEALKRNSPGADFVIRLPGPCAVEVDTSNGAIRVVGLKGVIKLDTSNGAVHAEDIDGDLTVDTSNGRVVVANVAGKCVIDTSNGSVKVTQACGDLRVDTSNGTISVDAVPPANGTVILDTSNGSIDAKLPAQMSADLKLDTSNGRVSVDFGDIPVKIQHRSKTHVSASMNGGTGGRIVVDTSNGSITLRFRQ